MVRRVLIILADFGSMVNPAFTLRGSEFASKKLNKCGFPNTIWTDDRDTSGQVHTEIDILEKQFLIWVPKAAVEEAKNWRIKRGRIWEVELKGKPDVNNVLLTKYKRMKKKRQPTLTT